MKGYSFICPALIYILSQAAARAILCWSVWRAHGGGQAEAFQEKKKKKGLCSFNVTESLNSRASPHTREPKFAFLSCFFGGEGVRGERKRLVAKCQQVPVNMYQRLIQSPLYARGGGRRKMSSKLWLACVCVRGEGRGDCKARMVMLLKGGNERVRVKERGKTGWAGEVS